jgi:hypothetical protein
MAASAAGTDYTVSVLSAGRHNAFARSLAGRDDAGRRALG